MEPPRIPELDALATKYESTRDRRMALTEKEIQLRGQLTEKMLESGLESYRIPDTLREVVVKHADPVAKVRKIKTDEIDDG